MDIVGGWAEGGRDEWMDGMMGGIIWLNVIMDE